MKKRRKNEKMKRDVFADHQNEKLKLLETKNSKDEKEMDKTAFEPKLRQFRARTT